MKHQMKMNLIKCLTTLLVAPFLAPGAAFAEGGGSTGGGSGVIFSDGRVQFVDLMSSHDVATATSNALEFQDVVSKFYTSNQFVKQAATLDAGFFSCASSVLNAQAARFPVLLKLTADLSKVVVLQTQFQIVTVPASEQYEKLNLPLPILSTASNRLPAIKQAALATYADNQLWVANRLYTRLSSQDRCGLSLHESLRHMNKMGLLETNFTQDEIEAATRMFMGLGQSAAVATKLRHPTLTMAEYDAVATAADAKAEVLSKQRWALLQAKPSEVARIAAWEQRLEANDNAYVREQSVACIARSHWGSARLNSPEMSNALSGLTEAVYAKPEILAALTTPLRGRKFWDVVNYKVVKQ